MKPAFPDHEFEQMLLGAYLLGVITEANGGIEPNTIWQYRRVARRLGVRLRFLPADALQGALLRQGQRAGQQGVIYVRRTHNMGQLRREILHELAEAASRWEGVPLCISSVSRHECASECVSLWQLAQRGHKEMLMNNSISDEKTGFSNVVDMKELTPAQRELLTLYRQQLSLWQQHTEVLQNHTELMQTQTEMFREMTERIMETNDGDDR